MGQNSWLDYLKSQRNNEVAVGGCHLPLKLKQEGQHLHNNPLGSLLRFIHYFLVEGVVLNEAGR